jgi:UDP-N-acetylmuramate--alanine ligase
MSRPDDLHYHIVGIGRADLSGIGRLLNTRGCDVSGSSLRPDEVTERLEEEGIDYRFGYDADHVDDADALVVPHSTSPDHVELRAARECDVEIYRRWELLADLLQGFRTIGVTGTHGRGTVAGMLTWIMDVAGLEPGFLASGVLENFDVSARDTDGDWMVVELDESLGAEHVLEPDYFVSSFMELGHLGGDPTSVLDSTSRYLNRNHRLKEAFVNLDCQGNRRLVEQLPLRPTGYSTHHRSEFRAEPRGGDETPGFEMYRRSEHLGSFELGISGGYNVVNALGAAAVAYCLGVGSDTIREGLSTYRGHERRYAISDGGDVTLVRDRGRHLDGVRRIVESFEPLAKGRLVAVLELSHLARLAEATGDPAELFDGVDTIVAAELETSDTTERASQPTWEQFESTCRAQGIDVRHVVGRQPLVAGLADMLEAEDTALFLGREGLFELADTVEAELARHAEETAVEPPQPRVDGPLVE